jgi:hypothetical protein
MEAFRPEENREYKVRLFRPRPFIKNDWSDGEYHFHYCLPNHRSGVLCEKQVFGRECLICDAASDMWKQAKLKGIDAQPTQIRIAKTLFAKKRFLMPAFIDDNPEPVIFSTGYKLMRQLAEKKYFDCLYRGLDFTYVLKSGGRTTFRYPTVEATFASSRTPVPLSTEQIEDLTRNTPSFRQTKFYNTIPPDEQRQEVAAFIAREMKENT